MSTRRRYLEPSEGVRPEGAQPAPLACLVVLLAAAAAGLAKFGGPPDPSRLPGLPSWGTLEVLARSPNPSLEGVLQVTVLIAWLVWGWAAASVLVELALVLAETGPAQGAAWLGQARSIADRLTLPLARRAIAAVFVVQLATRPALPALAFAAEPAAAIVRPATADVVGTFRSIARFEDLEPELAPRPGVIEHVVQKGDTLWSIAARYYGSGEEFDRVVDANIGTEMTDGRTFDRAGLIYPGWTLDIPLPSTVIEEHDGARWYVVQPGDTLCGIAARLLGGEARYTKLFQLNAGTRLGNDGPTLTSPDLIWPQLRLRLPGEAVAAPAESRQPDNASIELTPSSASERASPAGPPSAAAPERTPLPAPAGLPEVTPDESSATVVALPTPFPIDATADTALSADESTRSGGTMFTTPAQVAAGAALVALGAAATRALVRRRRRVAESDLEPVVALEQGFALADPARVLGHQLGGATDAPNEIANRLGRSYAAVLGSNLADNERAQVFGQVELVAVRHGQSSTTCVLSAPPAARAHLLRHLEPSVTAAFGDAVDIEGLVSHEGDVFIRLAGIDHRRLRLAVLDGPSAGESLWPSPLLVPLALLYDRQTLLANWHALSHVLVAGPLGQTAETVLVGLLASLVARRPPSDLALVTFASPNSLPVELTALPHQLVSPVDPANGAAVGAVLEQLRDELDRRGTADAQDGVDVVVVIRELAGLQDEYWELLGRLVSEGPRLRIHLLAASDQPAGELARSRSYLADFRTRLVLHTADEDASQALLGAAGAEELGPGGQLLIRLEGRTPVRAHGFRVAADHLARLVALMRQRAGAGFPPSQVPEPGELAPRT
ncbi:MAG TPA: LysM peptidoglycan-binding domain-containing protein, partial [Gemmataceae bacterium]|nr:LysM peptidoglycan-binding domain-containing protein [Gemmataceae bacterium]